MFHPRGVTVKRIKSNIIDDTIREIITSYLSAHHKAFPEKQDLKSEDE